MSVDLGTVNYSESEPCFHRVLSREGAFNPLVPSYQAMLSSLLDPSGLGWVSSWAGEENTWKLGSLGVS